MSTVKVTLDVLYMYVDNRVKSSSICMLLNELYELGVYKRMELYRPVYIYITNKDLASLKCLSKLHMKFIPLSKDDDDFDELPEDVDAPIDLKSLQSLQAFHVQTTSSIKDIGNGATSLKNLEQFHAQYANFGHIVSFVKKSAKLREIIIESFDNAVIFEELEFEDPWGFLKNAEKEPKFIDLYRLNRERAKLPDAKKITLYVNERLYLATKWAIRDTDLPFIRLKRIESFEMYYGLFITIFSY